MSSLPFVSPQKNRSILQLKFEKQDWQISKNVDEEKVDKIDSPECKLYENQAFALHILSDWIIT